MDLQILIALTVIGGLGMLTSLRILFEYERGVVFRLGKIIAADGEYQASTKLAEAADVISRHPVALQLRHLQTVVEISAEKNSTTIFPLPIELFARLIEKATGVKAGGFASGKEEAGEWPEARLLPQGVDREEVALAKRALLGLGTKTREPAVLDEGGGRTE